MWGVLVRKAEGRELLWIFKLLIVLCINLISGGSILLIKNWLNYVRSFRVNENMFVKIQKLGQIIQIYYPDEKKLHIRTFQLGVFVNGTVCKKKLAKT